MPFADHQLHLVPELLHGQGFPPDGPVGTAIPAVNAVIGAFVADIQWGEENDPVAIDFPFQPVGQSVHFGYGLFIPVLD